MPAASPAAPTQALWARTIRRSVAMGNPRARSAAYSLSDPATAAASVWLVMMTETRIATRLPSTKATPAPDSTSQ